MVLFKRYSKDRNRSLLSARRTHPQGAQSIPPKVIFLSGALFLAFSILVVLISFAGLSPPEPQISRDQLSNERVVAEFDFTYQSDLLTQRRIAEERERIPPFYEIDMDAYHRFARTLGNLEFHFSEKERDLPGEDAERRAAVERFIKEFLEKNDVQLPVRSTKRFFLSASAGDRNRVLQDALAALRDIHARGIVSEEDQNFRGVRSFNIHSAEEDEVRSSAQVQRLLDARIALRNELAALDTSDAIFESLYSILAGSIRSNLLFDPERTREMRDAAARRVEPVKVTVDEGSTIIEPGIPVTNLAYEKFLEYRNVQAAQTTIHFYSDPVFQYRTLTTLLLLLAAVLILRLLFSKIANDTKSLGAIATIILLNLILFRTILLLDGTDFFAGSSGVDGVLAVAVPIALGPITISILLGPAIGVLCAFVLCSIYSLMLTETAAVLIAGILTSLIGILFCHNIRLRTNVVRASFMSGIALSILILFYGVLLESDVALMGRQILVALISAFLTGIVVLGLLPLLERLFHFTTDITLLEYTDFNHPLLRRMQIEAPGTYHHSLMVANLSENAAAEIGANALVCRACSLFHDIGKIIKPEYFTENQQSGENPLLLQKPSMSAVIIKRHVKDGVELARQYKLPRIFSDVIQQHHGTTIIQYFYMKALSLQKQNQLPLFSPQNIPGVSAEEVDENTYRYDGPKPRFVESAIIFFADSIEAASRSLKKVNAQSIQELLDTIFQSRIEDQQLDECPLTLEQIAMVKKSFTRTLLNSLHSRIAYPSEKKAAFEKDTNSEGTEEKEEADTDQQPV